MIEDETWELSKKRKFLRDILVSFAIAGRDTTAVWMTWTLYALIQNPEIYAKVIAELDDVMGDKITPAPEDLGRLKYFNNVLSETLRLYPSVPSVGRFAVKDDKLPDGTVVKAGTFVNYLNYYMGRSPIYWDNPLKFDPDRFNSPMKHPFQYAPFHAGPMQCLGRHMARNEAKTLLCVLLKKFDFKADPKKPIIPYFGILMPARDGAHMFIKTR